MADLFETNACDHRHVTVVPEKRDSVHHAKVICVHCRKFMKWLPKPENVQRQKENAEILTALSKLKDLPSWERQFVRQLSTLRHLSPKQQEKLLHIRDLHLGKEASL